MSKTFGFTGFKLKPSATDAKDSSKSNNSKLQKLFPLPSGLKLTGLSPAVNKIGSQRKHKTEEEYD